MKHVNVLLMKFVASFFVFWISIGLFFNASLTTIISFSLLVTITSYLVGDLILLPRIGKMNSVIADFFLTYILVWVFGGIFFESYLMIAWGSVISALLIAASEVFVHSYVVKNVKPIIRERQRSFNQSFAFEVAEEQDPKPKKE